MDLPPEGCQVGPLAASAFSYGVLLANGITPPSPADIQVLIGQSPTGWSEVQFLIPGLTLTGEQALTFEIRYVIDPPPSIIRDFEMDLLANSPVAPGTATITANLCIGGTLPNDCSGIERTLSVFHRGTPNGIKRTDRTTFDPVPVVGVQLLFQLAANGASSQIDGVATSAQVIPEPGTWALMAGGLALLAARRFRRS